jgi:hypothetical protein
MYIQPCSFIKQHGGAFACSLDLFGPWHGTSVCYWLFIVEACVQFHASPCGVSDGPMLHIHISHLATLGVFVWTASLPLFFDDRQSFVFPVFPLCNTNACTYHRSDGNEVLSLLQDRADDPHRLGTVSQRLRRRSLWQCINPIKNLSLYHGMTYFLIFV